MLVKCPLGKIQPSSLVALKTPNLAGNVEWAEGPVFYDGDENDMSQTNGRVLDTRNSRE